MWPPDFVKHEDIREWQRETLPEGFAIAALMVAVLAAFACIALAHFCAWMMS